MQKKRYLYTENRLSGLMRYLVTRETDSNIWIKINEKYEERIPKKTYKTGTEISEKTAFIMKRQQERQENS